MFGSLTSLDSLFEEFRRTEQQIDELFGSGTQPPRSARSPAARTPRSTWAPRQMASTSTYSRPA